MAAYVVVNIEVLEPESYEEYKRLAPPSIRAYGGRYIARGGAVDVREGDWTPRRLVILEFPTVEQARAWWESPEYAPAKALRQRCARADLVITEGQS
jgi:uncharacterized protein (DUF1330 family)